MKKMKLHSITAIFMLAVLLAASLGGAVCEASCAPVSTGMAHHACCPGEMAGSSLHSGIGISAACDHPSHEQASLPTAPVFVTPVLKTAAMPAPIDFTVDAAQPAVPAAVSPPVFHLQI